MPTVIPHGLEHLTEQVRLVRGVVPRVQVDVQNGTYTKHTSWPYNGVDRDVLQAMRRQDDGLPFWQDIEYEVDLLLERPEDHIDEWVLAGAQCLIVHVESTGALASICDRVRAARVELALAIKPSTDSALLAPYIDQAMFVQCMGNDRLGEQGVPLDISVPAKIEDIRMRWPGTVVGVDIGVREDTIGDLVRAGARRFAVGSGVYASGEPTLSVERLEALVRRGLEQTSAATQ